MKRKRRRQTPAKNTYEGIDPRPVVPESPIGAGLIGSADYEEGLAAYLARERGRFLAIVCTDNPYAAVWQPAEGTYERFAATVGN